MNPGRGIALKIASTFVFTLMLVCVKAVADRIPQGEIVFARSFFALIPIVDMLVWQGQLAASLRTARPWAHVTRGMVGLFGMAIDITTASLKKTLLEFNDPRPNYCKPSGLSLLLPAAQ